MIKKFLLGLMFCLVCSPCFAKEYYVLFEKDGTVLNIYPTSQSTPNKNEQKLFKIIKVELIGDVEYYEFFNNLMAPELNGDVIVKQRKNKLDAKTITGKMEKLTKQTIDSKVKSNLAVIAP